jgi:hypothetical protein
MSKERGSRGTPPKLAELDDFIFFCTKPGAYVRPCALARRPTRAAYEEEQVNILSFYNSFYKI